MQEGESVNGPSTYSDWQCCFRRTVMSVEARPTGVKCAYCCQQPQRDLGNHTRGYDMERMLLRLAEIGQPFAVFGCEPLLTRLAALERLFAEGHAKHGRTGIQTDATLLNDEHLDL
jgi:uncharacterized protein